MYKHLKHFWHLNSSSKIQDGCDEGPKLIKKVYNGVVFNLKKRLIVGY